MFIKLKQAMDILRDSSRVVVDDDCMTFVYLKEDQLDDVFLEISLTEYNSMEFMACDNKKVRIEDCTMYLFDSEGIERELLILTPKNIEDSI